MTPSELRALLEPHGIRPIKGRSQHFLLDESVVEAMADAAGIGVPSIQSQRVLEIGPGPGILTAALLERGADVVAVELDRKLCALLNGRFAPQIADAARTTGGCLILREGDALSFSNTELAAMFPSGAGEYALVANLPYAITSAILQKFLLEPPMPARMVVMIQKEVADRLLAKSGEMRSLSVLAQTYADITRVRQVPRGAFFPPPKVDSTVVRLERKSAEALRAFFSGTTPERYFSVVQAGFASPRKQLKNTLRAIQPDEEKLAAAFAKANISPSVRPETLTIEDWSRLSQAFS